MPVAADTPVIPPTMREALAHFKAFIQIECGLSNNTLMAYERDVNDLFAYLAGRSRQSLSEVTGRDLADHLSYLRVERKHSSATVTRHLATTRVFFRWLAAVGKISVDPSDVLERPTRWRRLPGLLSSRQLKILLESPVQAQQALEQTLNTRAALKPAQAELAQLLLLRDRALLELLYASGLRASEAATLLTRDYNDTLGVVLVTGKGDKQRLVPVGKPAREAVTQYLKLARPKLLKADGSDEGRLLLSRSGKPLERVAVWQLVKKHARLTKLEGPGQRVYPHLLRHSFATHLLSGGADLRVVQELLGHADIGTTEIYTHVDAARLREVQRKFHPRP